MVLLLPTRLHSTSKRGKRAAQAAWRPGTGGGVLSLDEAHAERQEAIKDRIVGATTAEEQGQQYRELRAASPKHQESARRWTADGRFVLDQLKTMNRGTGTLGGLLDLTRVGAIGHSLGGAAAAQAIITDSRVIAGVDLDGFVFGDLEEIPSNKAFMFVSAAKDWAGVGGSALRVFFENALGPAYLVNIDGFEHTTFKDLPLFLSAWPDQMDPQLARRAIDIQREYVGAFFRRHLTGDREPLLDGPSDDWPEVSISVNPGDPLPVYVPSIVEGNRAF